MYKEHPAFEKPDNVDIEIWRYMDFTKFVSLLDTRKLFFARADKLGDPFEGSFPKENVQHRKIAYKQMMASLPPTIRVVVDMPPNAQSQLFRDFSKFMFINSWHRSEHESAAMWRLYLKSDEGIAIQSTYNRLKDCFRKGTPDIFIGLVKYIDYTSDLISENNLFYRFLNKRKSFEHEQELRAITFQFPLTRDNPSNLPKPPFKDGMLVDIDLDLLIEKIQVAPKSPKWIRELVKSVMTKYGLNKPVMKSPLDDKAVY